MFWRGESLQYRLILTLSLFLIGSLHTMIFAIFQIPENFLMGHDSLSLSVVCKVILYSFAIGVSLGHQMLCRRFGLRKALYFGLVCNLVGIMTLLFNQYVSPTKGLISLIILDMMFFGMALTSVINALVTYIIIEFPKRVGLGIVALFAFFNLGPMTAPLLMDLSEAFHFEKFVYYFLIALLLISIWFVHVYFFDPPVSREVHLKKGSIIWRQLHYRLGLFVISITMYALTETSFSLWGYLKIQMILGEAVANETIPFFWLFLIVGQVFLLAPLYFVSAKRIFYFLVVMVILSACMFPIQSSSAGFVVWLAIAGFGCSAVFPILLSQMEKEMMPFARGNALLPYIEKSISLMFAGYFSGVGIMDLWVQIKSKSLYFDLSTHFHFAALFIAITCLVFIFLNLTAEKKL